MSVQTKVLVALKFYGFGSYQEITGSNLYTGVSQPSVCRAIEEITNALNQNEILGEYVKFPSNLEELQTARTRYHFYFRFSLFFQHQH